VIRTAAALAGCLAVVIAGAPGHAQAGAQTRTVQVSLKPDLAAYTPANGTDSASVDVFDSQDRAETDQVTAKGYDTVTGVGTPNGLAFILGLRRTAR
jgi:hypothetical protein